MAGEHDHNEAGGPSAVEELIEAGTSLAGSIGGAGVGLALAGPSGALLGAATGPLVTQGLRRVAREFRDRLLSKRETARIGTALWYAIAEMEQRLDAGQQARQDGFFDREVSEGRTSADELLEGTLRAAQQSYEERKLPYLGRLYAALAFDPTTSAATGHALIRLMQQLTYRQLLLLSLFGQNGGKGNPFRLREAFYDAGRTEEAPGIGHEAFDLYQRELIWLHQPNQNDGTTVFGTTDIRPAFMELEGLGNMLFRLARLDDMPVEDLRTLAKHLEEASPS